MLSWLADSRWFHPIDVLATNCGDPCFFCRPVQSLLPFQIVVEIFQVHQISYGRLYMSASFWWLGASFIFISSDCNRTLTRYGCWTGAQSATPLFVIPITYLATSWATICKKVSSSNFKRSSCITSRIRVMANRCVLLDSWSCSTSKESDSI
jgi:hypothetical protein